jgi:hypothetical protein
MEIWIPYGEVETLLTMQAENLAELIDPKPEDRMEQLVSQVLDKFKSSEKVIVCDYKPATVKLLKGVASQISLKDELRVISPFAKKIETSIPEMKGKVAEMPHGDARLAEEDGTALIVSNEFLDQSNKLVIASGEPDPLIGLIDARTSFCFSAINNSRRLAYLKRDSDLPHPLDENRSYEFLFQLSGKMPNTSYLTIVPRGSTPFSLVEGGIKDARENFLSIGVTQAKAIIAAAGGYWYDDTFSQTLRTVWGSIASVRKNGEIILVSECREGIGSEMLQMFVTGRITEDSLKRQVYADGIEEIAYLKRLREEYSVTLLSSLPDLYVKGRLGFKNARSMSEALVKLFDKIGRGAKTHVITRMCETLLFKA